ncbi:ABC transporter permease [Chromobacterium violaceum]|uniref:Osmoprotectant uptake system permease n=1 Tax=Chromobacterium violaceum TaxID=536 RepID=A0A202BF88_CHRVL|nr:ABC transporter permease [Chromobacterium violaceum]ATP30552.1 ABC transporter permease [Chromobacterium violaceum]ATP34461.1 ABC transporter permease [Chromobacterium violaceum]OVE50035.1 osmoprotectant uptake system permease [Chromobacterium violaceum]QIY79565.1 ABC transporter permease [Chromobacterium violaceum]
MRLRNRMQLVLALLLLAGFCSPLLSHAPNRLLGGQGLRLPALTGALWLIAPALPLLLSPWLPISRRLHRLLALCAVLLANGLLLLAGQEAARLGGGDPDALARTTFSAGFWLLLLAACLQLAESLRGLALSLPVRALAVCAACLPALALLAAGQLDALALLREYHNDPDAFRQALVRHLQLVGLSVLPAALLGAALGLAAFRLPRVGAWLFPLLNTLQTIPSLALFALLIAPLAWLGRLWPQSGIAGVGLAPAVTALTLYSLLPMTHGTLAALRQVPAAARDSARGIGMSPRQILLQVELPLALPVLITGLRVTTVQAVGLAAVAALIGAGGFGAILFQGLSASAPDQVLLGVLPIVLLTLCSDAVFKLLAYRLERAPR